MKRVIILTGHRKSGTSVFQRMFDGHDELCVYPVDLSLLYAYFPCFTKASDSEDYLLDRLSLVLGTSLRRSFENHRQDPEWEVQQIVSLFREALVNRDLWDRGDVIRAAADAWAAFQGDDRSKPFMFKETSQSLFFDEFLDAFPELKMMNIVRDPRDNYGALKSGVASYYEQLGEGELETLASLLNRVSIDLHSAKLNHEKWPQHFLSVRFEDLASETETVMRVAANFLDIRFDECLTVPTEYGEPYTGNSFEGKVFHGVSSENVGRWPERISEEEAMIIEYWLGDRMEEWGYERAFGKEESQRAFARFYEWYNCKYFYSDSFANG